MSKTFKYNPETHEQTTKHKRYGNARKKIAVLAIKERRKRRKEQGGLFEQDYPME